MDILPRRLLPLLLLLTPKIIERCWSLVVFFEHQEKRVALGDITLVVSLMMSDEYLHDELTIFKLKVVEDEPLVSNHCVG